MSVTSGDLDMCRTVNIKDPCAACLTAGVHRAVGCFQRVDWSSASHLEDCIVEQGLQPGLARSPRSVPSLQLS